MLFNKNYFKDKTVLITGSGQGIGAAIAETFASRGANVAVNDVNKITANKVVAKITASGGSAIYYPTDITNEEQVNSMINKIAADFGSLDILVNNAGIISTARTKELSIENWDKTMSVNLKGSFLCCKYALELMRDKNYGKIINISSLAGESGGIMVGADYSTSKAGMLALTKKLALEFAPFNINVNAVAPGTTKTPMIDAMTEAEQKVLSAKIPLKRFGLPEDIAYAVCFLASEESSFITGATLDVNGGLLMR